MKVTKTVYLLGACCFFSSFGYSQNVGIGTAIPAQKLHVSDATLPNAATIQVSGLATTTTLALGTAPFSVVMTDANGVMFRGGTAGVANNNAWMTLGNAGTSVATNFLGTTDNVTLAIRTNNLERMRVLNDGRVVVNNTAPIAGDVFSSYAAAGNYAVNGYATGTGGAGYFSNTGGGEAVIGVVTGATGSAGLFNTVTGANADATVDIYNATGTAPAILLRTDLANAAADGMEMDINGAAAKRGIDMYVDAAVTGIGIGVFHDGTNRCLNVQQQSVTNTQPGIFASVAGNARVMNAQSALTTHTNQIGFFAQGSTGLVTATYGNAASVWGQSTGIRGGVFLAGGASANTTALQGNYSGAAGNYDGIGVLGTFAPAALYGYGVVGQGNWYGVYAVGDLGASGIKPFMIDHPLDPAHKYLKHFSMESDEVLNMYRGTVTLDGNGEATVQLPSYFHSINIDFSYQLTAIGAPAQTFISQEINANGEFRIAGGNPNQKICWNVYAQRNDPYVQQNQSKIQVEFAKRPNDDGLYLMPELYGQPKELSIFERYKADPSKISTESGLPAQQTSPAGERNVKF